MCNELHDVEEWLLSVVESSSSLYSIQDLICYYIKVIDAFVYSCRLLNPVLLIVMIYYK